MHGKDNPGNESHDSDDFDEDDLLDQSLATGPLTIAVSNTTVTKSHEWEFSINDPALDYFEKLGRYKIDSEIARGGMGVIFKAYDEVLHRDVAVKLLQHQFLDKPIFCQRFVNEALLTSRLQHPCIVPIYDCGEAVDHRPYFAMKLIAGKSLGQILAEPQSSTLDRSRLLKIYEQVCLAMAYAHSHGALHLDLKPANIMVGEFGEVHVMDWGLARMWPAATSSYSEYAVDTEGNTINRSAIAVIGTAAYMAPEQARNEEVCPRTDIFGLGALLCEILTGRPPYRGRDYRRVHIRAMQGNLTDALKRLNECSGDERLVNLAKQCLAPARDDRPADAATVAEAIGRYLESALEQAESDLCRFFNLSLDLFCIATQDGFFLRVNVNFPRVLGYTEEELVSETFLNFVHPDDQAQTYDVMKDLMIGKPVVQFCNRYRHRDGHYVLLEWTAQSIADEGVIFAVARDVTNRPN
jgi:eukaryotic-like serine/threonine-protein kinase